MIDLTKFKHQSWLDGRIVVINDDCEKVMADIGDKEIDLVLTDPPYLYLNHHLDIKFNQEYVFNQFYRILNKDRCLLFFGRGESFYYWNNLAKQYGFNFKEEIIWDKNQPTSPTLTLQRIHETIALHQKGNFKLNDVYIDYFEYNVEAEKTFENDLKRLISSINNLKNIDDLNKWKEDNCTEQRKNKHSITSKLQFYKDRGFNVFKMVSQGRKLSSVCRVAREHYNFIHPTQKPIKLLKHLLNLSSNADYLVFDPFLGSGSTAIACIKTKRRLIGCELDPIYFEKMCERIETELKQGVLF